MPYAIKYYSFEGRAGLKARVQRKADGLWWDEVADAWVAAESANCDIALAETATVGEYSGQATFTPAAGTLYDLWIYAVAAPLVVAEDTYRPGRKTALQIINEVQQGLRLPQDGAINRPHAQLILSFVNKTMDLMKEAGVWDELKAAISLYTADGVSLYYVNPPNTESVDIIRSLRIGDSPPLVKASDTEFRELQRIHSGAKQQPLYYRHYGRAGRWLIIEVCPTPDQAYRLQGEILQRQEKLAAADDVPLLDADTIVMGALALAKAEQGSDSTNESAVFQAKITLQSGTEAESNWGDVEPV